MSQIRRKLLAGAVIGGIVTMLGLPTAPALAISKAKLVEEFRPFADCPVTMAANCTLSLTTGGEFKMGSKTVPINKTITLQGGLGSESFAAQPLVGAADGNTLSKTPLTVPGGLTGVGGTEGITGEVTATSEIAGPPSSVIINRFGIAPAWSHEETAVTLPLKIHLENPNLGNECYIGSNTEPIILHLTAGKTKPPSPAEPISGDVGIIGGAAAGKIRILPTKLVDNTFAVPGATGCGSNPAVTDNVVDAASGIPSPAGSNTAIMRGMAEETKSEFAVKYRPKVKKHR
jgi:hypothetical protein